MANLEAEKRSKLKISKITPVERLTFMTFKSLDEISILFKLWGIQPDQIVRRNVNGKPDSIGFIDHPHVARKGEDGQFVFTRKGLDLVLEMASGKFVPKSSRDQLRFDVVRK